MNKLILVAVLFAISTCATASSTDRVYNFVCGNQFVSDIADYANTFLGLTVNDVPYTNGAFMGHRVIKGQAVTSAIAGNGKTNETIVALSFYEDGQVVFTMADGPNASHPIYTAYCRSVN